MRTLQDARSSWQDLCAFRDVKEFHERVKHKSADRSLPSRSIYWKVFLLFESTDQSLWLRKLGDSRSAYVSLRGHFLRAIDHPDEVDAGNDPLSEDSPWQSLRSDEALRAEIRQDVERCMPESTYFRQDRVQAFMLDILFIFCKLNPDVSYRQGMHELVAPVLWVMECDAISDPTTDSDDFVIMQVCDARFVEHDAFTIFNIIMQNAKKFYEQHANRRDARPGQNAKNGTLENPILTVINRIFNDYLPRLDSQLADHLRSIELVPQVFLIRWIRLIFGREFSLDDVLRVWDVILSDDSSLRLVEFLCLVMLLRVRWELLDADHNAALVLLLKYPTDSDLDPRELAIDATALQQNFNASFAGTLIKKYTGKQADLNPDLPDPDDFAIIDEAEAREPVSVPVSPRRFESILQDAAKNVYNRGEKWGINKAVRDAMDEVRRGVKEIQTIPTPQAPRRHGRLLSRSSGSSAQRTFEFERKLGALQARNDQLARMLKSTTDELWKFQKLLSDEKGVDAEVVKDLSMTIAKVGFVQVYLEDATIPLPPDESPASSTSPEAKNNIKTHTAAGGATSPPSKDPAIDQATPADEITTEGKDSGTPSTPKLLPSPHLNVTPPAAASSIAATSTASASTSKVQQPTTPTLDPEKSRPKLAQSSFSWMLGQEERHPSPFNDTTPTSASAASPYSGRPRSRGFLFGTDDEGGDEDHHGDDGGVRGGAARNQQGSGTPTRRRGKERKVVRRGGGAAGVAGTGGGKDGGSGDEDGFDLNDLRRD